MSRRPHLINFIPRTLIGIVLFFNLTCALQFLVFPQTYLGSFGLLKENGTAVIRGYGILFIMWNVPYLFAFINPIRFIISLYEAIIMQSIGILGEGWIMNSLPQHVEQTKNTVSRFLYFDVFGLLALISAMIIIKNIKQTQLPTE